MTPLDNAHSAMAAAPENHGLRLAFYECLVGSELFLLLEQEDSEAPRLFETAEGRFLLVFDQEDRLTAFTKSPAPYAALSGRALAEMIGNQDIGLGLNLDTAPSSFLIPAGAIAWLNDMLATAPTEATAVPESFAAPKNLPEHLLTSFDARLATAQGLATKAFLAAVNYSDGRRGHLLAIIDAVPDARPALSRAISEAVVFSGVDVGEFDVIFLAATDPATAKLSRVGLCFDLPTPKSPIRPDPTLPPKLC